MGNTGATDGLKYEFTYASIKYNYIKVGQLAINILNKVLDRVI